MITGIICIILIVLWTMISLNNTDWTWDIEYIIYAIVVIILLMPIFFVTIEGFMVYPALMGQKAKIEVLQENIEIVRAAYYKERQSEGAIVNGSLTNMWQSSNLSDYLVELSKEKAKYNSKLTIAKLYRNNLVYVLWWKGFSISKKVKEL